jgi:hypothetical protein
MQENLNLKGIWFLPNNPDKGITGLLEYSPDKGAKLQLMGVFEDTHHSQHEPEFINGISADGNQITLYKCYRFGRGFNSNSFETSSYDALFMFIGTFFWDKKELKFQKISFVFEDFDKWVNAFGFKKIHSNEESREITIEYQRPDDILFNISERINCEIQFDVQYPLSNQISNATIKQISGVSIWSSNGANTFEELFEWFQSFHRLMTLAYFTRPLISDLKVSVKKKSNEGEEYNSTVAVYFQTETTKANYKKINSDNYFLFTYREVKENFEIILQRWFLIEGLMEPTVGGLTESFIKREQPLELRFLSLVQAIETIHRRTSDETKYNNEQHKVKINEILKSISADYKDWVQEKLRYSHEPTLKERLDELSDKIPNSVREILLKPTEAKFINQVRDNRNYYTHYDPKGKSRVLKGSELFFLSERMKIFLICLILREIGFTDGEIVQSIFRKGVFLFNHIIKYEEVKEYFSKK